MDLFVGCPKERTGRAQNNRGKRESAQRESETGINPNMKDFVIGQGNPGIHPFDLRAGQQRDTQNGQIVEGRDQEVFPSQLGHREGILGVA